MDSKLLRNLKNLGTSVADEEFKELRSAMSPAQMMYLQCTTVIFEEGLEKLKMSLFLPIILSNPIVLSRCLANTKYEGAYELVKQYFARREQIDARRQHLKELRELRNICQLRQGGSMHGPRQDSPNITRPFTGYKPKFVCKKSRRTSGELEGFDSNLSLLKAEKRKPTGQPYKKNYPHYSERVEFPTRDPFKPTKPKPVENDGKRRPPKALKLVRRVSHKVVYIVGMSSRRKSSIKPRSSKKSIDHSRRDKSLIKPEQLQQADKNAETAAKEQQQPPKEEEPMLSYEEAKAAAAKRAAEAKEAEMERRILERQQSIEEMIKPAETTPARALEALEAIDAFAGEDFLPPEQEKRNTIQALLQKKVEVPLNLKDPRASEQLLLEEIRRLHEQHVLQLKLRPKAPPDALQMEEDAITMRLIDYFFQNTGMLKYMPDWMEDLDDRATILITTFELLGNIAGKVLSRTALYTISMEKVLSSMYKRNLELINNIQKTDEQLRRKQARMRWVTSAKATVRNQIINSLESKRRLTDELIGDEMKNCRRNMRRIDEENRAKRETFERQLENLKFDAVKTVRTNDQAVMVARDERNKLLIQLETLLRKRDKVLLDKFREKMDLQRKHELESVAGHEVYETYLDVKDEHNDVVVGYYNRKIEHLKRKRAVRIIGEWILRIWKMRKERSKKGKKKKAVQPPPEDDDD